jgi:hypothetical protein
MFDFTINSPEDWYRIQNTIIKNWKKDHGIFFNDIKKLEKSVENYISEYSKKLVLYRQTGRTSYYEAAIQELKTASELLKTFSKREMLATLSKG